jgi:hypothetical protein
MVGEMPTVGSSRESVALYDDDGVDRAQIREML